MFFQAQHACTRECTRRPKGVTGGASLGYPGGAERGWGVMPRFSIRWA